MTARILSDDRGETPFEYLSAISERDIQDALQRGPSARKLFMEAVHQFHGVAPEELFTACTPRILCRPSGEGKTTELNYIRYMYGQFSWPSPKRSIEMKFDQSWVKRSRGELFRILQRKLGVHNALTLEEAIQSAKRQRLLIVLDNVENLSEDALVWLLASVHSIEESNQYLFAETGIYIGIAGSVGLGQLSRELFSVYYTDELPFHIRDYLADDVNQIGRLASARFRIAVQPGAKKALMELTGGEKRSVNLLCDMLLRRASRARGKEEAEIVADDVGVALSQYLDHGFRRDTRWLAALDAIYATPGGVRVADSLAKDDATEWIEVPSVAQKVLYNLGVVSVEAGVARPRNQVVRHLLERSVLRLRNTKRFLSSMLPTGRSLPYHARKERTVRRHHLQTRAFIGATLWICYGEVVDHDEAGEVYRVRIVDEDGNTFEMQLTAKDFGMPLRPNQGFLKYAVWTSEGPREEYYFYGSP